MLKSISGGAGEVTYVAVKDKRNCLDKRIFFGKLEPVFHMCCSIEIKKHLICTRVSHFNIKSTSQALHITSANVR